MRNLTLGALGFVVLYNIFFFQTDSGIGTGLFFLLLNLFYYFFKKEDSQNVNLAISCSLLSTVFGFLVGFRANEIVGFINFLTAIFFSVCALYFYKASFRFSFEIPQFFQIPVVAVAGSLASLLKVFSYKGGLPSENTQSSKYTSLIRGLLITVPVMLILLMLLTRADPIFNKLVANLFNDIWERVIVSVLVFASLIASSTALIKKLNEDEVTKLEADHKAYELLIILGGITILFAAFLMVQINYFFSNAGERELHTLGITSLTYSEYVRKGFFELLGASTVAAGVMLYVMKFLHKLPKPQILWTQILSSALTLEIALLLISAGQRINLYQQAHGLTRARVFGFIFLVWLGIMLAVFLFRILRNLKKEVLFTAFMLPTLGVLFLINLLNIDGLIATKYRPSVNNEIDYYYLTHLSADGVESWKEAVEDAKVTLARLEPSKNFSSEEYRQLYWTRATLERLDSMSKFLKDKYGDYSKIKTENEKDRERVNRLRKWQGYNRGEDEAFEVIIQNQELFGEVEQLLNKARDFDYHRVGNGIRQTAPLDRATQPPLL